MADPITPEFSPWEHLQDVWRKVHNRRVREHFRDINETEEGWNNWQPNLDFPRHALYIACYMDDNDTGDMCTIRTLLFWVVLGQATSMHPPLYAMPTDRYQQSVKFAPQVTLYFKEDLEDVEESYGPIDAELSFRLMDENSSSMTEAKARTLANKIKQEFATNNGYRWQKGRVKLSYRDKENGYQFSINAYSESVGRQLISKILDIQNSVFDDSKLSIAELGETPPTVPPSEMIYGQSRRIPRKRPVGYVRFIYAEMHVWGILNAIVLLDRSGRRKNPLVEA